MACYKKMLNALVVVKRKTVFVDFGVDLFRIFILTAISAIRSTAAAGALNTLFLCCLKFAIKGNALS